MLRDIYENLSSESNKSDDILLGKVWNEKIDSEEVNTNANQNLY